MFSKFAVKQTGRTILLTFWETFTVDNKVFFLQNDLKRYSEMSVRRNKMSKLPALLLNNI